MTLNDLGNIGDIVAAIGVIASLIYVAIQIRQNSDQIKQNTNSVQASVELEDVRASSDFLTTLAVNPDLARIWRVGLSAPHDLTEDEGLRFAMLMGSAFFALEGPFRQYKRGLLSEDSWSPMVELIARYLQSPAVIEWWRRREVPFSAPFREYVETLIPPEMQSNEEILPTIWPDAKPD